MKTETMPDRKIRKLIRRLKCILKSCKDKRMHERLQAIYLYLKGYPKEEISNITGRSLTTIYTYINAFEDSGLRGLRMNHSPGRPNFLNQEQRQIVRDVVAYKVPKDVGFPVEMNWTGPLVRQWIEKEFGIKYSIRGTFALLHSLGLSATRPTYTLANADPAKQEAFKKNSPK